MPKIEVPPQYMMYEWDYIRAFQKAAAGIGQILDGLPDGSRQAAMEGARAGANERARSLAGECATCADVKDLIGAGRLQERSPFDVLADICQLLRVELEPEASTKKCSVCLEPQADTIHGAVSKNGHGGAPSGES